MTTWVETKAQNRWTRKRFSEDSDWNVNDERSQYKLLKLGQRRLPP